MMKNIRFWALAFVAAIVIVTGCTGILGSFDVASTNAEAGAPPDLGKACGTGAECSTGFCTDGVCCESACNGTCESCVAGEKGRCSPIPDGQDPAVECTGEVRPDAGTTTDPIDAGDLDAGDPDAADADGGDIDAGMPVDVDASSVVNIPDGGIVSTDKTCAGTCNGARACKFPGKETSCGSKFCNTGSQQAASVCNGKGLCDLALDVCSAYACTGDACNKTCAANTDCLDTHFCNPQSQCQQKLANGLQCALGTQCSSGFCVTDPGASTGVCCNSECGLIPGGKCGATGSEGKCKCLAEDGLACAGSCRLEYKDLDNDGHGDEKATKGNGGVKVGCDDRTVNPGFVPNNDDCSDMDNRAFPGQTSYFGTPVIGGSVMYPYDFNCDKKIDKSIREFPGASCHFCGPPKTCDTISTCTTKGQTGRLSCDLYYDAIGCVVVGGSCYYCGGSARFSTYNKGFNSTVACGASGAYVTCGACSAVGGAPTASAVDAQQLCR